MKQTLVLAVAALASVAVAGPHQMHRHHAKRDVVMVTQVATAVETDIVYETVWVDANGAPEATATPSAAAVTSEAPVAAPTSAAAPAPEQSSADAPVVQASSVETPAAAPSSAYTPPVVAPAPTSVYTPPAAPSSVYTPPAVATSAAPVAPAPVSSAAPVAPAPVSSAAPSAAAPASGGSGVSYQGKATFYDVGLGSCGTTNVASDMIVAAAPQFMKAACGKKINISVGGKTQTATIMDTCPSCDAGHLDMSRGLFGALSNNDFDLGVLQGLTWSFA